MAKRTKVPPQPTTVSRDDLEQRFRALQDGVRGQVDDRKSTFLTAAGIIGLLVVLIIFLAGRRSGKKKTTYVEIRRV
ncbi:MAG: hypothetical protein ABW219_08310 [Ilumatobacteraceae bacterium]